jgi:3-phosphoshikimate 1-carboxyvinyltransferase
VSSRLTVAPGRPLRGEVRLPGDKSISHRALVFNSLAAGHAQVRGLLQADDVRATFRCLLRLGTNLRQEGDTVHIVGRSGRFAEPGDVLDCGNSGTTMRLLAGLLAGQGLHAILTGDASLRQRPMLRVVRPLNGLGARIDGRDGGERAPLSVRGGALHAGRVECPVASAQVRTALLLAGLQAEGPVCVAQPALGRDHSERMLPAMGARLAVRHGEGVEVEVWPGPLSAIDIDVPADPSSAAPLVVAALLVPGSDILLRSVGLNPGRIGFLRVLERMGADIEITARGGVGGEPVGDLRVRASALQGVDIAPSEVPDLLDELPILAVAGAAASGETRVTGAMELRHKESDRIKNTVALLRAVGVDADELADGYALRGGGDRHTALIDSPHDHRIAMAAAVLGLCVPDGVGVDGAQSIATSFPEFPSLLERLRD